MLWSIGPPGDDSRQEDKGKENSRANVYPAHSGHLLF